MRLQKADRESLRRAMPGDLITVAGAERNEAFSLVWTVDGQWALLHGAVVARAPDRVTERIIEAQRGDAMTISRTLEKLGADLPTPEQASGATDFPTPRDIYWRWCLDRLPGEHLESPQYAWRVAFSIVPARTGWKILCMEEVAADRLEYGDYLDAVETDDAPEMRVLRWWRGRTIGNRHGIISEADLYGALLCVGVDPDTVSSLSFDEVEEEDDPIARIVAMFADTGREEESGGIHMLPVEVIGAESPLQERISTRRYAR
jgi:hypothetical protein